MRSSSPPVRGVRTRAALLPCELPRVARLAPADDARHCHRSAPLRIEPGAERPARSFVARGPAWSDLPDSRRERARGAPPNAGRAAILRTARSEARHPCRSASTGRAGVVHHLRGADPALHAGVATYEVSVSRSMAGGTFVLPRRPTRSSTTSSWPDARPAAIVLEIDGPSGFDLSGPNLCWGRRGRGVQAPCSITTRRLAHRLRAWRLSASAASGFESAYDRERPLVMTRVASRPTAAAGSEDRLRQHGVRGRHRIYVRAYRLLRLPIEGAVQAKSRVWRRVRD